MKHIKILLHHASYYFDVFYLGWSAEKVVTWKRNSIMKQHGVATIRKVIDNSAQLVSIVAGRPDEFCRMCPTNEKGGNFIPRMYGCYPFSYRGFIPSEEGELAEFLGLSELLNKGPVPSRAFFQLMQPTYQKFFTPSKSRGRKKVHIRDIFYSYQGIPLIKI